MFDLVRAHYKRGRTVADRGLDLDIKGPLLADPALCICVSSVHEPGGEFALSVLISNVRYFRHLVWRDMLKTVAGLGALAQSAGPVVQGERREKLG